MKFVLIPIYGIIYNVTPYAFIRFIITYDMVIETFLPFETGLYFTGIGGYR